MIVVYLCICKKYYNPRHIKEYQISDIYSCYGIAGQSQE